MDRQQFTTSVGGRTEKPPTQVVLNSEDQQRLALQFQMLAGLATGGQIGIKPVDPRSTAMPTDSTPEGLLKQLAEQYLEQVRCAALSPPLDRNLTRLFAPQKRLTDPNRVASMIAEKEAELEGLRQLAASTHSRGAPVRTEATSQGEITHNVPDPRAEAQAQMAAQWQQLVAQNPQLAAQMEVRAFDAVSDSFGWEPDSSLV
jgi:hypothetical protein